MMPWSLYDSYQKIADYIDGALSYHRDTVNDFELAAEIASQNFGVEDSAFNSFTHAYVSALIAYEGDPHTSAFVGYIREAKVVLLGYDDKDLDTWKDLYNNKVGIQIAEYGIQNGLSFEQVTALVAAAAESGTIIVDPYDTPILEPWQFPLSGVEPQINFEELTSSAFANDTFPVLSISSEVASEGETLYFKVSIEGGAVEHDITFQATTFQGTTSNFNPDGGSPDYKGVNGTWTIEAGETYVLIPVQTDEDNVHEGTETLELHVTEIEGASEETLVAIGTIIDDDPAGPSFEAANFSTDLSSVLATADYTLSHDGVGDQDNVVVTAYVDTNRNGIWDNSDTQVGYENAYNLRDDENDNEEIELTGLREHLGDQTLFLTVQSDEVDERVIVTDEVTVEAVDVNFTLDDFEWTPDGSETRVDYDISHDLDGDVSGVRVRWYADTNGNGTWDDSDDYLGYESAGTLRDGEVDSEGETLEDLGDYDGQGDVLIFTTIEADGIGEHVHRDDVVDMGGNDGPDIDLSIEDITFREDRLLSDGQDVRADFVVVNSGSESTAGMDERTGIFWSADDHFDFNEDMMIDYDTHGTLYAGERDSEYERTHYEDIPEGQGYLFYVVDPLDMIAETNEMNNVSDAYMVWVL